MKLRRIPAIFLVFLAAMPLSAQNWEVYDNFKGPLIDPDLWSGSQRDGNALEFVRQIQNGWLQMWLRSCGQIWNDDGGQLVQSTLYMAKPAGTIGIGARLTITRATANYCPIRPPDNAAGSFALSAAFFNSGSGDQIDDIVADLWINLPPSGQPLSFDGYVHDRQINAGQVHLGDIKIGETFYVWVRWDQSTKQIFFGLQHLLPNRPPVEEAIPYTWSDNRPPASMVRVVNLQTWPQNCSHVQIISDMMVKIDQVTVLR